jgi:hypothetical protein
VENHPAAALFHTLAWRDAVAAAFGHEAIYLTAARGGRLTGVLPLFYIPSRLGGRMLVSVPYGVGGGVLTDDMEAAIGLFAAARRIAERRGCVRIDLRSERAGIPGVPMVTGYAGFVRELPDDPAEVLSWLPRKARAAARNGRDKYRLSAAWAGDPLRGSYDPLRGGYYLLRGGDDSLRTVWDLYARNMRRLGSLAYPFAFFEQLTAHTPGRHWVLLVLRQGRPVAGLLTFLFGDRVMPFFFGSSSEARRCSAANFAYLTLMERGVREGYRLFDFGRSRRSNPGSYEFKRLHGFEPRPLEYQMWTAPGCEGSGLCPDNPRFHLARRAWKYLPLRLTTVLGARLARHVPG